ncbi:LysR family transcriptional regulator [Vibrio methylphosphonaticus]|uniref:LysR family transcriptional regulator n=1 Tax=Vibrio methylphosphonaticus TaxID=2946866 RepID=UPI00202A2F12|nr:LysR family transcriptional regulator [Vibrio methylphosphonaticus]MCL9774008.1 LysR family transcriptional regulator [Vibrio methylphosphonaticus]
MFSYEHLAAFCATLEEGSYSQAAKKLGKDRTTVREQVKALEDSYALTLFDIQGKKAVPSKEGDAIYRHAKLLVHNTERLNSRMMDNYKTEFTSFDIYHDILVPNSLIVHVDHYIKRAFPLIKVNWLHRNRQDILHEVSSKPNALALMQYRLHNKTEQNYEYIHLGSNELAVFCNPNHPLTKVKPLGIGDLELAKQYVSENHIHSLAEVFSVSIDQHIVSNNDVLLALLQHDGWAFSSRALVAPLVKTGQLVELPTEEIVASLKIGLSFYYPISMKRSHELEGLQSVLRAYAKEHLN